MKTRHILAAASLLATMTAGAQTTIWQLPKDFDSNRNLTYTARYDSVDSISMRPRRMTFHSGKVKKSYNFPTTGESNKFVTQRPRLATWQPTELGDFNNSNNDYCYARSKESEHFIVFWQKAFGNDPTKAPSGYAFDPQTLLDEAEKIYKVNTEQLGFGDYYTSNTLGNYKGELFVLYQTDWLATGSGYDDKIQAFWCNPAAVNDASTVAHEIGHTFQYVVYCDLGKGHGWREGFGPNGNGGNMFWESCAQWQSYQAYPDETFSGWYYSYPGYSYANQFHEVPRYSNYFFQYYWCQLHGQDFIGRLWRNEVKPEDPVDAYKRLTGITQEQYCDEMNDYARRAVTWDIDGLRTLGSSHRDAFTTTFHNNEDGWVEVNAQNCVQNYGFNVYRVKLPAAGTEVKVNFRGEAGKDGYRKYKVEEAGWRYSFVALLNNDERVYSEIGCDSVGTLSFTVPDGTKNLWFVVSGAPKHHFHHEWNSTDDTMNTGNADDEQWPYAFNMEGADVEGHNKTIITREDSTVNMDVALDYNDKSGFSESIDINVKHICDILGVDESALSLARSTQDADSIKFCAVAADTLCHTYGSRYSMTFYYDNEGKLMDAATNTNLGATASYIVGYTYYNNYHLISFFENAGHHLQSGQSVTFPLAFVRYLSDGSHITAKFNVNISIQ